VVGCPEAVLSILLEVVCLEAVRSNFQAVEHSNLVVVVDQGYDTGGTQQVAVFYFHGNACTAHIHCRNGIVPLA